MLVALVLVAVGLASLRWLWPMARMFLITRNIPGPRGYPLIGNLLHAPRSCNDAFNKLERFLELYGRVCRFWGGPMVMVVLTDPADVKEFHARIAANNNRPKIITNSVRMFTGPSSVTLRDDKWATHRKIITPMFQYSVLKSFLPVFNEKARELCTQLAEVADGRRVNVIRYTDTCFIRLILATLTGSRMANREARERLFVEAVCRSDELMMEVIARPWLQVPYLRAFFAARKEIVATGKCMTEFVQQIVVDSLREYREKRSRREAGPTGLGGDRDAEATGRFSSLLDLMIHESESNTAKFSTVEMKDELLSMTTAGYITSSSTLSFLFILLGMHPEVQDEISRELDQVFGSDLRPASADDIIGLPALERALKETLRLLPAVPFAPRDIVEDIHLPSGYVVPAGAVAMVYTYRLHRDPDSFYEPDSFVPDRWLPENVGRVHTHAFLPFSTGPRGCIGYRYAMMQLKVFASHVLRRFTVATPLKMADLTNINVSLGLKLNAEYNVQLCRRSGTDLV